MKALLLSAYDAGGGAAAAAMNLLQALCSSGIDARMGVLRKKTSDPRVFELPRRAREHQLAGKAFRALRALAGRRKFRTSNPILHSEAKRSRVSVKYINSSDFDIVHMHWVNDDMLSVEDIARIEKPLVWTMHDCWPFCGAEHYPNLWEGDARYRERYSRRNKPASSQGIDVCANTWRRKERNWRRVDIRFISPSRWEMTLGLESALLNSADIRLIPNIVPSTVFRKSDQRALREQLGIPSSKKAIGFGAAYDIHNGKSIKGGNLLVEALQKLENPEKYHLLVFGPAMEDFIKAIGIGATFCGFVENPRILAALYACCDLYVCPSVIENLPMSVLEATKCGLPVAAFDTGGIPDIVSHKETGYLAKLFDAEDLARGIEYCASNASALSEAGLKRSTELFSERDIIERHVECYVEAIESRRAKMAP
jgi:glycosyltransferase involved in cell wall biosynthesis